MAMTAADRIELKDNYVSLTQYKEDKTATDARIQCVEKKQSETDVAFAKISTQTAIIMWFLAIIVGGVATLVIKQFWG